jgi:hypothetical protein
LDVVECPLNEKEDHSLWPRFTGSFEFHKVQGFVFFAYVSRALPLFVLHRQDWNLLRPNVDLRNPVELEDLEQTGR